MEETKIKYILVKVDLNKCKIANKKYYEKNKTEIIKKKIEKNKILRKTPEYREYNKLYMREYNKRKKEKILNNKIII